MRNKKLIQNKCLACGKAFHGYRRLTECYSCGVSKWRQLEKDAGVSPHTFTDAKVSG